MKALVYGGLGLWLMSLGVWAYGEISSTTTELRGVQDHAAATGERRTGPDLREGSAVPGSARAGARPLRLESFAQADEGLRSLSLPGSLASGAEEPL